MVLDKSKFEIIGCADADSDRIERPNITYWGDAWRRLKKNPVAMLSLIFLVLIILFCIFAPYFSPYKYNDQNYDLINKSPFGNHWFGTDNLGRDLFVRVWKGGRVSLIIGFVGTAIELLVGCLYGGICGYFGGKLDTFMMRIIEVLSTIPDIIIIMLLLIVLQPSVGTIIISICIIGWVGIARLIRGQVMQLRNSEYVMAAKALGAGPFRIILKHLLPNTIGVIIVYMTLDIPALIFEEAFLSFLGLGVQAPDTSWGALVFGGMGVMTNHPYILAFPATAICLTVLAFNLFGDGLRDALDPNLRQ